MRTGRGPGQAPLDPYLRQFPASHSQSLAATIHRNLTDESAVRCLREFIQVQENWLIVLALGLDGAKYLI
jgi:hypothetical protein